MSSIVPYTFDQVFEDLWRTTVPYSFYTTTASRCYHQSSTDDEYVIEMPMIGISKEKLSVEVQDNVLTVSATNDKKSTLVKDVRQSWTLRKDCDVENISATLENGLLNLRIPRVKPAKKVVSVKVN